MRGNQKFCWNANGTVAKENNLAVPLKVKQLSYGPAIPCLGVYPREMKTCT